jgi:hypothetical protein
MIAITHRSAPAAGAATPSLCLCGARFARRFGDVVSVLISWLRNLFDVAPNVAPRLLTVSEGQGMPALTL